jgi:hypothetical protein
MNRTNQFLWNEIQKEALIFCLPGAAFGFVVAMLVLGNYVTRISCVIGCLAGFAIGLCLRHIRHREMDDRNRNIVNYALSRMDWDGWFQINNRSTGA